MSVFASLFLKFSRVFLYMTQGDHKRICTIFAQPCITLCPIVPYWPNTTL